MAACLAERPEGIGWSLSSCFESQDYLLKLLNLYVRCVVLPENVPDGRFACGHNHLRRRQSPDSILESVDLKQLFWVVQRVVHSINGQLRAFGNELPV